MDRKQKQSKPKPRKGWSNLLAQDIYENGMPERLLPDVFIDETIPNWKQ